MPRFKFQWANLPDELQRGLLPEDQRGSASASDDLKKAFGARPKEEFIRDQWPVLLENWLRKDAQSCELLTSSLRSLGLGDTSITSNIDYLVGCKNTKNLRSYALRAFLDFGEQSLSQSPNAEAIREIAAAGNVQISASAPKVEVTTSDDDALKPVIMKALAAISLHFQVPVDKIHIDDDDDISIPWGSSNIFLRVCTGSSQEFTRYMVFAPLLSGVDETPAVFELLNEVNKKLVMGSMTYASNHVILEDSVLSSISGESLGHLIEYIAVMADDYDNKLQQYLGGELFYREKNEDEVDV